MNAELLEELHLLRGIVGDIITTQGDLHANDAATREFAWERAEEWAGINQEYWEPSTNLYFECHITLEPTEDNPLLLKVVARDHGFRVAKFLMKKGETLEPDDFLTSRSQSYADLETRMYDCIESLKATGFKVTRYKIENTLLDSRAAE
jgi:hypothetical protein